MWEKASAIVHVLLRSQHYLRMDFMMNCVHTYRREQLRECRDWEKYTEFPNDQTKADGEQDMPHAKAQGGTAIKAVNF